jgi:hypothetical protein
LSSLRWTFKDAVGKPIPNAAVQVQIRYAAVDSPKLLLEHTQTDQAGQIEAFLLPNKWGFVTFRVSHPDYGTAIYNGFLDDLHDRLKDAVMFPLVRAESEEDQTSVFGKVVGTDDQPMAGVEIFCVEIRTLGEGLLMPQEDGQRFAVITDDAGRFRIYPPLSDQYKEQHGNLIPPKSKYRLHIPMPNEAPYRSWKEWVNNDAEALIRLETKEPSEFIKPPSMSGSNVFRRFIFRDKDGQAFTSQQQENIVVHIYRDNQPTLKLEYNAWKQGALLPFGRYEASAKIQRRPLPFPIEYKFKPLEVDSNSPTKLVFELPDPVFYYGRVMDGITGKPLPNFFVAGSLTTNNDKNLACLSDEQWLAINRLSNPIDLHDPALDPIRELYSLFTCQKTDAQGKFLCSALPAENVRLWVISGENYLPVMRLTLPNVTQNTDFGDFYMFPAAKMKLHVVVPEKNIAVKAKWVFEKDQSPLWAEKTYSAERRYLRTNEPETIFVPANAPFRLKLEISYADQWAPLEVDEVFNAKHGETIDAGKLLLQPAIPIFIKVVDPQGQPVEGVPLRLPQTVAHITDIEGRAKFYVPENSSGSAGIQYHNIETKKSMGKLIQYEVQGKEDAGKEYLIQLSEEELKSLFE